MAMSLAAITVAVIGALAAPAIAIPHASPASIRTCMKSGTRRPLSLETRVVKHGRRETVTMSGTIQRTSPACAKLGTRVMKAHGIASTAGRESRITNTHAFAKARAEGLTKLRMKVLGKDSVRCSAKPASSASAHFVSSLLVVSWTSRKGSRTATETYQSIDTKQSCTFS
jgi:hypothetical protein